MLPNKIYLSLNLQFVFSLIQTKLKKFTKAYDSTKSLK